MKANGELRKNKEMSLYNICSVYQFINKLKTNKTI